MNAVIQTPDTIPASPVTEAGQLMAVITKAASDPAVDVDKLERLMAMYERINAKRAEQEFNEDMVAAKAMMPAVLHNSENTFTQSTYADLEAVSNAMDPVITQYGFTLSFGTSDSPLPNHYRMVCTVRHKGGHSVTEHADVPADLAGAKGGTNKNPTQAFGSTMTYGRRYMKMMIFDVVTREKDDDGRGASKVPSNRSADDPTWRGPLAKTKLKDALNALFRDVESVEDADTLIGLLSKSKAIMAQAPADLPQWWTGKGDVRGLKVAISQAGDQLGCKKEVMQFIDNAEKSSELKCD